MMRRSLRKASLLILVASTLLLCAESPSPQPSPRESTQATSQSSDTAENKAAANQTTAAQPSAIPPIASPAPDKQSELSKITAKNKDESVPVRVAPVDINRNWIDYINPLLTFLLVVVGAAYAKLMQCELRAINYQAKLAEQAAKDDQEALRFVPTGEAQFGMRDGTMPDGQMLPMRLTLKNSGRTPALQITAKGTYDIKGWYEPMPTDELSSKNIISLGAVGPNVTLEFPLDIIGPFGTPTRTQVLDGTYRLTVRGYIEYRGHIDTPKPYTTKFCFVWFPPIFTAEARFVLAGPYNDCT